MNESRATLPLRMGSRCAVIVAHPDDETLWAGGTMLGHPDAQWMIVTLCRESDADRAPRFYRACGIYGAEGRMADLDDGPDQTPLQTHEVQETILRLLPSDHYDLILTHDYWGEYTRHLRHEEVARAVTALRRMGRLRARHLLRFAYDDKDRKHLPEALNQADISIDLGEDAWRTKHRIITETYGFTPDSWEARTTPRREAFWVSTGS